MVRFVDAIGHVGNGNVWILCLYENKQSTGMAALAGGKHDPAEDTCNWDAENWVPFCAQATKYNLKGMGRVLVDGRGIFNYACLEAFSCIAGDDCPSRSCSTWGGITDMWWGSIPVAAANNTTPLTPTGLVITPQDKALNIKWNEVTNIEIFAYQVAILRAGEPVVIGYTQNTLRNVTISELKNGQAYTVEIKAISFNNFYSPAAAGTGTPGHAVETGNVSFVTVPPDADIYLDGTLRGVKTPATITNLPSGYHPYKLILSGYKDATGTVRIEAGTTKTVSVSLTKVEAAIGAGTIIGIGLVGVCVLGVIIMSRS